MHPEQAWSIIGEYKDPSKGWMVEKWHETGRYHFVGGLNSLDLMLPEPEPKQLRGWVNVYRSGQRAWFDSKEMADSPSCAAFRTECLYIDRPYEEGEGL